MDKLLALMCGTDIPIPECQLILHQPKMKEIAYIGETEFFTGVQSICINKNMISQGETLLVDTSNFQIFMTIMNEKQTADKKQAVISLLTLLFPSKKVLFTPRSLIFSEADKDTITIDENNFDFLQEAIKEVFCVNAGHGDQTTFNPQDKKAKEIAEKLMRGRARIAAQNGGASAVSVFSQYISVLTVAISSMSIHDCINLTMFQLYDLVERYGLWVNWDLDVRSRLAGGKPDSKPDNWMKNIH